MNRESIYYFRTNLRKYLIDNSIFIHAIKIVFKQQKCIAKDILIEDNRVKALLKELRSDMMKRQT